MTFEDYSKFYQESEYAAWTAAFGIRVNHFTVYVNALRSFKGLPDLNDFLRSNDLALSQAGGEIKGSTEQGLEQSSTVARKVPWRFAGGASHDIMSCYYEFAARYVKRGQSELFQGFLPDSANRIFESNFERRS